MDNFDLKKYLAEGKLYEEDNSSDYIKLGRLFQKINNFSGTYDTDEDYEELGRRIVDRGYNSNLQKALDSNFGDAPLGKKSKPNADIQPYTDELRREEAEGLAADIELEGEIAQRFINDVMKATEDESWGTFYDIADKIMVKYM